MTQKIIFIAAIVLCTGFASETFAQNYQEKTQELINALSKTKYKKKEKKNFAFETYVDVRSEAAVKNNAAEYTGIYQSSDANHRLELRVSADGRAEGSGFDTNLMTSEKQSFGLRDAKIEGALLTATKVYANGKQERFEAVFTNQTIAKGKNPNEIESRESRYGLGFVEFFGDLTSRVFLEFKQ